MVVRPAEDLLSAASRLIAESIRDPDLQFAEEGKVRWTPSIPLAISYSITPSALSPASREDSRAMTQDDCHAVPTVSGLLTKVSAGDKNAADELLPLVYSQLRAAAQRCLQGERPDHTLSATALVHEAYMRLVGPRQIPWQNKAHFYSAAAESIRRILLDYARSNRRQKRGGRGKKVALTVANLAELTSSENPDGILALDEAVCRLEDENPEAGKIVRLRFFAGLTVDQTAAAMDLPPRTVERRWSFARAWLHQELSR